MCANSEGSGKTVQIAYVYVISTTMSWAGSILILALMKIFLPNNQAVNLSLWLQQLMTTELCEKYLKFMEIQSPCSYLDGFMAAKKKKENGSRQYF